MISMIRDTVALLLLYSSVIMSRCLMKSCSDAHLVLIATVLLCLPLADIFDTIAPLFGCRGEHLQHGMPALEKQLDHFLVTR